MMAFGQTELGLSCFSLVVGLLLAYLVTQKKIDYLRFVMIVTFLTGRAVSGHVLDNIFNTESMVTSGSAWPLAFSATS